MPIRLIYPELLLLAIPIWFAYRRWGRVSGFTGVLRIALLALLLLAMTGPQLNRGVAGDRHHHCRRPLALASRRCRTPHP